MPVSSVLKSSSQNPVILGNYHPVASHNFLRNVVGFQLKSTIKQVCTMGFKSGHRVKTTVVILMDDLNWDPGWGHSTSLGSIRHLSSIQYNNEPLYL